MAEFYSARGWEIPPLPWTNLSPPFSGRWPNGRLPGKQVVSEYRYYEVQAIDRPLGEADMEALRTLSTRARITATSFTNHYKWGDF